MTSINLPTYLVEIATGMYFEFGVPDFEVEAVKFAV
jgi:hypothetical protein